MVHKVRRFDSQSVLAVQLRGAALYFHPLPTPSHYRSAKQGFTKLQRSTLMAMVNKSMSFSPLGRDLLFFRCSGITFDTAHSNVINITIRRANTRVIHRSNRLNNSNHKVIQFGRCKLTVLKPVHLLFTRHLSALPPSSLGFISY